MLVGCDCYLVRWQLATASRGDSGWSGEWILVRAGCRCVQNNKQQQVKILLLCYGATCMLETRRLGKVDTASYLYASVVTFHEACNRACIAR
jgi:hypothetical protein